jgi:predicted nucleic acid-binding protein
VILVDAGVFVAAAFPNDRHHEVCRAFLLDPGDTLAVSDLVVAEICHLFKRSPHRPRPEIAFLRLLAEPSARAAGRSSLPGSCRRSRAL